MRASHRAGAFRQARRGRACRGFTCQTAKPSLRANGSRTRRKQSRRPGERRDPYAVTSIGEDAVRRLWCNDSSPWLWVPAFAGTTKIIPATHFARGLREISLPSRTEGAGNTGCTLHPRSRVQSCTKKAHEHTGSAEAVRHSLRNGFTAYFVISPAIRLCCHRRPRKIAFANLNANHEASEPHDFAVRLGAVRQKRRRVHRIRPQRS
jgi:hypothetical protein